MPPIDFPQSVLDSVPSISGRLTSFLNHLTDPSAAGRVKRPIVVVTSGDDLSIMPSIHDQYTPRTILMAD